jgi:diadenylate cyclase
MTATSLQEFALHYWKDGLEILILSVGIYYAYLGIRGTRGARVLTGLATLVLGLSLLSQIFGLEVIGWLIRSLSAVVIIALVVIFQPELRRLLAELGSHRLFDTQQQNLEAVEILATALVDLSSKHLGALVAVERGTDLGAHTESGVELDCKLSSEVMVTIFHPKTPLHDGGVVIRNERIAAAACIFPVSQRQDLDRNLGLRHRAAIGLTEESDAVLLIVSEETGNISLCTRGKLERDFTAESLRKRLAELLIGNKAENPAAKASVLR